MSSKLSMHTFPEASPMNRMMQKKTPSIITFRSKVQGWQKCDLLKLDVHNP